MRLCVKNMKMINDPVHWADKLEAVKKTAQEKGSEIDKLRSEIAEKEKAEAEVQQKLSDIQDEDTQLKESLQQKEGEYILDEAVCKEHAGNQRLCTHSEGELEAVKKISKVQSAELAKLQSKVADKESVEADLQQQLTGIEGAKTQLKVSLQKKEGEYVLDEAL